MVAAGESAVTNAATSMAGADSISGWTAADHSIDFAGAGPAFGAGSVGNYSETIAADYATAFVNANTAFDGVGAYHAAEITGTGVVIFHDNDLHVRGWRRRPAAGGQDAGRHRLRQHYLAATSAANLRGRLSGRPLFCAQSA